MTEPPALTAIRADGYAAVAAGGNDVVETVADVVGRSRWSARRMRLVPGISCREEASPC